MRSPVDDEPSVGRPIPFGSVGLEHVSLPANTKRRAGEIVCADDTVQTQLLAILSPVFFYGMLGLMAMAGWLIYQASTVEFKPGVPLYAAATLAIVLLISGAVFWYLRDVKNLAATAIAQIVVATSVVTWIIISSDDPFRWIAAVGGIVTIANGFKTLMELVKKNQAIKP